jgi:hypothetical protein
MYNLKNSSQCHFLGIVLNIKMQKNEWPTPAVFVMLRIHEIFSLTGVLNNHTKHHSFKRVLPELFLSTFWMQTDNTSIKVAAAAG